VEAHSVFGVEPYGFGVIGHGPVVVLFVVISASPASKS
jgi:hypothetical protein